MNSRTFANKLVFVGTTALGTREGRRHSARHALRGRGSPCDGRGQFAAGRLPSRPEHRIAPRDAARDRLRCARPALPALRPVWGPTTIGHAARCGDVLLDVVDQRHVPLPALPHLGLQRSARVDDRGGPARRASSGGPPAQENAASRRLMVQTLLSLTGIRDLETGKHSVRTQSYTRASSRSSCRSIPAPRLPLRRAHRAARQPGALHDIGKVACPIACSTNPAS